MNADRIERILHDNVGKAVRVKTAKGHPAILEVRNVDQEGFSYRIIEDSDWHPGQERWSQFDEFTEVEPVDDCHAEH
jgi:hypothetical protein